MSLQNQDTNDYCAYPPSPASLKFKGHLIFQHQHRKQTPSQTGDAILQAIHGIQIGCSSNNFVSF